MAVQADVITSLIKKAFPDAEITLQDLAGDNDHYAVKICSSRFANKSRVQQHKMVYQALEGKMDKELHALSIQTTSK